jgi:hypothetical protein
MNLLECARDQDLSLRAIWPQLRNRITLLQDLVSFDHMEAEYRRQREFTAAVSSGDMNLKDGSIWALRRAGHPLLFEELHAIMQRHGFLSGSGNAQSGKHRLRIALKACARQSKAIQLPPGKIVADTIISLAPEGTGS